MSSPNFTLLGAILNARVAVRKATGRQDLQGLGDKIYEALDTQAQERWDETGLKKDVLTIDPVNIERSLCQEPLQ